MGNCHLFRLHIYEVNVIGNASKGNSEGDIKYKLRTNDLENFNKKHESIIQEMKQIGLNLEEIQSKNIKSKKLSDCLPVNLKWNDTKMKNYTKHKPSYEETRMIPKKIKEEE